MTELTPAEEQRLLTRDRIMRALAEEVLESGAHELSVQAVADRAGVSHRTVYRHFPSKAELFQAYGGWVDARHGGSDQTRPKELDALGERAAEVFRVFDTEPMVMEAYSRIVATGVGVDVRRARHDAFVEIVSVATPHVSERHQRALAAVLRQVVNSQTWASARFEFDAEGEALAETVRWVVETVVGAINRRELPTEWETEER